MTMADNAHAWQRRIWDSYPDTYAREIDRRFAAVVEGVIARAELRPGLTVLDLGTGTGSVGLLAAPLVLPGGRVIAVDISPAMLAAAAQRASAAGLENVEIR